MSVSMSLPTAFGGRYFLFFQVLIVSFVLSACGVGVDGADDFRAQQARDSKALQSRFDRIRGVYEGELIGESMGEAIKDRSLRARLFLYVLPVREGINPDGTTKIRPALYGRLELIDAVSETDTLTLSGDYDEFGYLSMTSLSGSGPSGGSDRLALALFGQVFGDRASLDVSRKGGRWGRFEAAKISSDAPAPEGGEDVNYRDRLRKLYEKMEGVYEGILEGGPERNRVEITLTVGQGPGANGGLAPILNGQFRYSDLPRGVGERQLRVEFDSLTGQISMDAIAGGGSIPGSQFLSLEGTWVEGFLRVRIRDSRGALGNLVATRR